MTRTVPRSVHTFPTPPSPLSSHSLPSPTFSFVQTFFHSNFPAFILSPSFFRSLPPSPSPFRMCVCSQRIQAHGEQCILCCTPSLTFCSLPLTRISSIPTFQLSFPTSILSISQSTFAHCALSLPHDHAFAATLFTDLTLQSVRCADITVGCCWSSLASADVELGSDGFRHAVLDHLNTHQHVLPTCIPSSIPRS